MLDRYIRKYRSILGVSGLAVIVFGIWSIIKGVLSILTDKSLLKVNGEFSISLTITVIVIVLAELALRLFVGISAIKESRGKRKSAAYLVFVGILIIFSIASLYMTIAASDGRDVVEMIVELLMEGTSLLCLIEVMVFSIKLRKKLKEKEQMQ